MGALRRALIESPPHRATTSVTAAVLAALLGAGSAKARQDSGPGAAAVDPKPATTDAPATASRIVAPRLVHFEPADYPAQALEDAIQGTVTLRITIDERGRVADVQVAEAAGHGFDGVAMAAARRFVFEPALRDGVPVAVTILYRYEFELDAHPDAAEPSEPAPPNPTSAPSDARPETPVEDTGTPPSPEDEVPLEIRVRGGVLAREVTHYELERTELLRMPGTMGDAVHAVEAMPSVARPRGLSGELVVRGSASQDTQVYIEGTPIPQVFHYGDLSSVIPGEMIERLEFYPSNFSARYGRAMGGVVEIRLRETNPDGGYHGSAQLDFLNARANVEGPVPKLRGYSFMGGFRTSYLDRWLAPMMRSGADPEDGLPRYYDYQLYVERPMPRQGLFRVGLIGSRDTFVPIRPGVKGWYVPRRASFQHLQSTLRVPLGEEVDFAGSWSLGRNRSYASDGERSTESVYSVGALRTEVSVRTGLYGIARLGTDVLYAPFEVQARTDRRFVEGELATTAIDSPELTPYDIHGVSLRPAAYLEYELAPSHRLDITAGTRVDYARDTDEVDVAPRLAARAVLVEAPLSTVLKGGIGLFYQPPDPSQTVPELGTADLVSSRAVHLMVGVEQALTKNVGLSVEAFAKQLRRLLDVRQDGSGNEVVDDEGRGRVLGADVLLRYHADEHFFGWVAYTLSRATRQARASAPRELERHDQTHVLNLVGSYRLGSGWEAGGRFRYATGLPYRDCFGGLFDSATGEYRCYGTFAQERLGPFHQLDLRIEKAWERQDHRLSVYLDLINVYFHYSPDKAVPSYDYSGVKPLSRSLPLLPSLGIRGEL